MDWLFTDENRICDVRVAGILMKDGKLLVQKAVDKNEYAILGGHLQFGETTKQALVREYLEETGVNIVCRRLLWIEECFWSWNGADAHNICFYYLIDACEELALPDGFSPLYDNSSVVYGWLPVDELVSINIYPRFLKEEIHDLADHPKHFVTRDQRYRNRKEDFYG